MESSPKRHKISAELFAGLDHDLIDFKARSTAQLSTASTFTLQTQELLKETRLDCNQALQGAHETLHLLKNLIDSIESHEKAPLQQVTARLAKKNHITVPYPDPKPARDCPYEISFEKPAQCNVVGSYVCKTMVRKQRSIGIDMVIQMPKSLFQEKDYLDIRYFYRRAYFIAYITAHIREHAGDRFQLDFENFHENALLPVLVVRPLSAHAVGEKIAEQRIKESKHRSAQYFIRIIPCAPEGLFPWTKLTPASKCIRMGSQKVDDVEKPNLASTFYNSTLNAEQSFLQYLSILTQAQKECSEFRDACILGRIWLQQRNFGSAISEGGFGPSEWSIMLALLLRIGGRNDTVVISHSLSSVEIFRAAIHFLSMSDFVNKPFAFNANHLDLKTIREHGPVMFDPSRRLNILFKMTRSSAKLLHLYAKASADLLFDTFTDKFNQMFIVKSDPISHIFDAVLRIKLPEVSVGPLDGTHYDTPGGKGCHELAKVLSKAYGDRAELVHIQEQQQTSWPVEMAAPKRELWVLACVIFNPSHMSHQMEYGPSAEAQKEADTFRHFWGEKAELRRFRDGRLLECVEWTSRSPLHLYGEITRYALKRHLNILKDEIEVVAHDQAALLSTSISDKSTFDACRQAFSTLERDIRNLEDLPLQIRQLSPKSPVARYSSVKLPMLGLDLDALHPMDINVYFEASSQWPENLTAIQEVKMDFLLDLDRRLTTAHNNITTHLCRENGESSIEPMAYLEVVYDSGASFRLRIHCDVERTLLHQQAEDKDLNHAAREAAANALVRLHWQFTVLPLHTQVVATFGTRLWTFSETVRLVKLWFESHKLSAHFREELIELIVMRTFLEPYPWTVPSSSATGFLRTIFLLSRWDWRETPLILDTAESLSVDGRSSIAQQFEQWRKRDPHMQQCVLFVATSQEKSGLSYTREGPSYLIASRMTRLAKAACKLVREQSPRIDLVSLFKTSLRDFDVLIHFSSQATNGIIREASVEAGAKRQSHFKNLDARTGSLPLPLRSDPVDVLIEELQRAYQDTLVFFRGDRSDLVVAAIWSPKLLEMQRFRPGLPYNFRRAKSEGDKDLVQANRTSILLEIARAGGDMINKIEVIDDEV